MKFLKYLTFISCILQCQSWNLFKTKLSKYLVKTTKAVAIASIALNSNLFIQSAISDSRLNAPTAAGTRVNSDPESLLRYGLPINDKQIREVQESVETAKINLKTRRVNFAKNDISNAEGKLKKYYNSIVSAASLDKQENIKVAIQKFYDDIPSYEKAVTSEMSSGSGSVQERKALDQAFLTQDILAKDITSIEELLVPTSFKRSIPSEYANLPQLQGRAEVKVIFNKPDNSEFNVDGKLYDKIEMKMVIDGYNAPLTSGNFIDLIQNKFYNKKPVTRSDGFVVQLGDADPSGEVHGYVPPGAKEERKVPLELSFKDDPELLYDITSEDEGRGSAAATLPFQSYGALGMARGEFEPNSASSQFFMLLFESDLTPAGKNMLDGRYTCFGYIVENEDLLKGIKEGDIISEIKVVKGIENFIPGK